MLRVACSNARMSVSLSIAVVEDHADLRELFVDFLKGQGHDVVGFTGADELDEFLPGSAVDLLVLDLNLPGEDGFSIAKRLRESRPSLYIIMITARTALDDRIKGYASGADIYLAKPVAPAELGAATSSIVRRFEAANAQQMQLVIYSDRMELAGPPGHVRLTPSELRLLQAMSEAPERKLAYWRLYELLQIEANDKSKGALEVRISRLKKKLLQAGAPEPAIKSVWKSGYQLCVPVCLR